MWEITPAKSASGDGTARQLDVKRPSRALEERCQTAATRTERRLHVQVTSPNRTSGQYREFSLTARLLLGNLCYGLWLLKNSLAEIAQKIRCARMLYKRFSPPGYTFLVPHFEPIFGKMGFFNTHACSRQPTAPEPITPIELSG